MITTRTPNPATYGGYSLSRVDGSGYWSAWRPGARALVADSRDGIRELIRQYNARGGW
jgi:hypothetical protein